MINTDTCGIPVLQIYDYTSSQFSWLLTTSPSLHPQAIYERMFTWIVGQINEAIKVTQNVTMTGKSTVIGVLDIYGFEIFDNNRYSFARIIYNNHLII